MPEHPQWLPKSQVLTIEEIAQLARVMVLDGITHIRLTGGEPLLRRGLRECVATLDALRPLGLQRISMTSNASLLAPLAAQLKAAGLDDLNISRSEEHTSELQSLMRISYAVFCLKKKKNK